ncbi:MAG TPA: flagellar hook-basal body complex protein FliE [Gemmatimonadales bacterium]|nr:flagellar hook-basal body complex protein FliE [Gemmatimonadales bacterium]
MTTPIRPDLPIISPIERGDGVPLDPTIGAGGDKFGDLLGQALGGVEQMQTQKDNVIGAFLRGEPVELHQVMAAAEEASLSLQLLVETRNKLTDAYRTIMNMQI